MTAKEKELRSEIERLKAALIEIRDSTRIYAVGLQAIADKALSH